MPLADLPIAEESVAAMNFGRKSHASWPLYVLSGSRARAGISRQPRRP